MFNQVLNSFLGHFGSSFLTKRQSASWFHEIGENNTDSGHSWVWSHLWILMVYWNKKSFRGPSVYKEGTNHWQKFRYIPIVSPIVVVCVHVCTWKFEVWLYQGQLVWHQEPKSLQVLGPGVFFFAPSKDKLHQYICILHQSFTRFTLWRVPTGLKHLPRAHSYRSRVRSCPCAHLASIAVGWVRNVSAASGL